MRPRRHRKRSAKGIVTTPFAVLFRVVVLIAH
jgi:hypothetical protein